MYFVQVITNIIVKIGANFIFIIKTMKNPIKIIVFTSISENTEN